MHIDKNARPMVMGILNVTPDSFADGGQYTSHDEAIAHAMQMIEEGADIIDVGGESSRPGAQLVSLDEELTRVIPVIEKIRALTDIPISIDTYKPQVMEHAVKAGATMINDIYALSQPGAMAMAAKLAVPVCLMHMQGTPQTMQQNPSYHDLLGEITQFFTQAVDNCINSGIVKDKIILDPGFGFGKSVAHNLQLVAELECFTVHGCPLLLGVSRKSTVGAVLNAPLEDRLVGGLTLTAIGVNNGANIIRTHDVRETVQAVTMAWAVKSINK